MYSLGEAKLYYIHKHRVSLQYGGPEEGGCWYDTGVPDKDWDTNPYQQGFVDEEAAYEVCRALNGKEKERAKKEEDYEYHSVLAYRSNHFSYSVHDTPIMEEYPKERPHYE